MVRTAGWTGGMLRPAIRAMTTNCQISRSSSAMAMIAAAQTIRVRVSTRRMPRRPISLLVRGPAIAWPIDIEPSTRPAAAYESCTRSTWSRNASESIPNGKRAVSCAAMMRPTPGVFRSSV